MRAGVLLLAAACAAQDASTFRTTVPLVVAPVSVADRDGRPVDGLLASDFQLLVDSRQQQFDADITIQPIALVIAVQTGGDSAAPLAKVRRVGSMIQPLITGERGVAAVLAHDSELRVLQPFTADPFAITAAFEKLWPSTGPGRMLDTAGKAIGMLLREVPGHRRVLLLIGESRDGASESKLEHVLTDAQIHNVAVYSLTWSVFLSAWAAAPGEAPPQGSVNDLLALFRHLRKQGKENAAAQLAEFTGGRRLSFVRQGALEEAVAAIGEELHSQYLLSFPPRPEDRPGFHSIQVRVPSRPDATVRTRPGYWLAAPE